MSRSHCSAQPSLCNTPAPPARTSCRANSSRPTRAIPGDTHAPPRFLLPCCAHHPGIASGSAASGRRTFPSPSAASPGLGAAAQGCSHAFSCRLPAGRPCAEAGGAAGRCLPAAGTHRPVREALAPCESSLGARRRFPGGRDGVPADPSVSMTCHGEHGARVGVRWVWVQGAGAAARGVRAQVQPESFEEQTHVSFAIPLGLKKKCRETNLNSCKVNYHCLRMAPGKSSVV